MPGRPGAWQGEGERRKRSTERRDRRKWGGREGDGEIDVQREKNKRMRVSVEQQSGRRRVSPKGWEKADFHLKWKCSHKRLGDQIDAGYPGREGSHADSPENATQKQAQRGRLSQETADSFLFRHLASTPSPAPAANALARPASPGRWFSLSSHHSAPKT